MVASSGTSAVRLLAERTGLTADLSEAVDPCHVGDGALGEGTESCMTLQQHIPNGIHVVCRNRGGPPGPHPTPGETGRDADHTRSASTW